MTTVGRWLSQLPFAGNLLGHTRTMPLAVYVALETEPEAAIVLSLVLVLVSGVLLFMLRKQWFPVR